MKSLTPQLTTTLLENGIIPDNIPELVSAGFSMEPTAGMMYHKNIVSANQVTLHSHNFFELIYCRYVDSAEYLLGPRRYRLRSGDILIIPPETAHCPLLSTDSTATFERETLWVSPELFHKYGYNLPDHFLFNIHSPALLRTGNSRWAYIGDYFKHANEEADLQRYQWEDWLFGNTILLLVAVSRALSDLESVALEMDTPQLFDKIIQYIERNFTGKITLEEASRLNYTSKSTIARLFSKYTGTSFYRYVTQRRLIEAVSHIRNGIPLDTIAVMVGFADYPSFYRAFKQEYGISPSQFRKAQKEG